MITFTKKIILLGLSNIVPTYIYIQTHSKNPSSLRYLVK
jgi:hypothetical protein